MAADSAVHEAMQRAIAEQGRRITEQTTYGEIVHYLHETANILAHDTRASQLSPDELAQLIHAQVMEALRNTSPKMLARIIASERNGTGPGPQWQAGHR